VNAEQWMISLGKIRSLRTILFVCFTLISAIPVLLLAGWVQQTALQNQYDAAHEKHLVSAKHLTGSLNRYISDLKSGIRIAGTSADQGRRPAEVHRFLNELDVSQVWILAESKARLYMDFRAKDEFVSLPVSVNQYFNKNKSAIDADESGVYISGVMAGYNDKPVVAAFRRLENGSYLVGIVRTDYVVSVQQAISFGKLGHAAIIDQHGKVLAHPLPNWVAAMKDISFIPPVVKTMAGVTVFYTPAMQADMIAGHTTVKETGWGVMIPQPVSELEENAAGLKIISLSIAAAGILLAAIVSWLVARFITRPLADIADYSESVASGSLKKYSPNKRSFIPTELRKLLVSFENMVDALLAKTSDLEETSSKLSEAQKIAKLGNWEIRNNEKAMWCSDEIYSILSFNKTTSGAKSSEEEKIQTYCDFISSFSDVDKSLLEKKLQSATSVGSSFTLEHCLQKGGTKPLYLKHDVLVKNASNSEGNIIVGTLQDISERKEYEHSLIRQAHFDSLTRLPNRNLCVDRLTQAIAKAKRSATSVSLLVIGLDHFKEVNDTMGHLAGDALLCSASDRLQSLLRDSDTLARLGSDEFAVIIEEELGADAVPAVTQKIVESFKKPFDISDCEVLIGASVGISVFPQDDDAALGLLQKSDTALHSSKVKGLGTVTVFKAEMDALVHNRMSLRSDLSTALESNEFHLVFQPIVDSSSGEVVSSEALLRWTHPEKGLIPPDMFIPIAEDTGYIGDIGLWVLDSAVKQLSEWRMQGHTSLKVSINLSVKQMQMGLTPKNVVDILRKHDVPADKLTLEMTESMFVEDLDSVKRWMMDLRQEGVQFSIDDFGTGYSSLSYLLSLPVTTIKIDRCFVSSMLNGSKDETLVSAIIALSQKLGFVVVAEGVEEQGELCKLLEYQCEYIQGFFFSKPLLPSDFEQVLAEGNLSWMRKAS
jgi:diguanylate cyclase (GGDEF)-like protein